MRLFKYFSFLIIVALISCTEKVSDNKKNIVPPDSLKSIEKIKNETKEEIAEEIPLVQTKKIKFSEDIPLRGIYLSAYIVASSKYDGITKKAEKAGINSVTFDLKNMNGHVFYKSPLLASYGREKVKPIIDIPKLVKDLHSRDMKAVSRLVMFHDMYLAKQDTLLCPKYENGQVWRESKRRQPSWLDSSHPENQKRLLGIIKEVARQGVDEIQLDYVRFPTGGNLSEAIFYFQEEDEKRAQRDTLYVRRTKYDVIESFVRRAKAICDKYDVTLAADVFAIVSWQHYQDVKNTGQKLSYITQHLDYIHPMIYTSHFARNFNYRQDVWNEPYDILFKGTSLTINNSSEECRIAPYIQANAWKVNYTKDYIYSQISAIADAGGSGFLLWNAQNNYDDVLDWLSK